VTRPIKHRLSLVAGVVVLASAGVARVAAAQVELKSRALEITLTGRLQTQFNSTSVSGERASEFLIRRARLTAEIVVSDLVHGKVQPDFGEGRLALKDAYMQLRFSPALRTTFGQFKRPFDVFELTSSTQILVVERAGGVNGVDTCAGPGGLCAYSRFTEKLGFSDRDIGVMADGRFNGGQLEYAVSVTNGTGANREDENGSRSFSGRVAVVPLRGLRVAANAGAHDFTNPATGDEYAVAFGGDVEYGNFNEGLHVQAGLTTGDNWLNLVATDPTRFVTTQGIVTYKLPLTAGGYLSGIEPLFRVSWGDPDRATPGDAGWLLTPGFVAHIVGRNKIAANVDIWSPASGDTEWSLKVQAGMHF